MACPELSNVHRDFIREHFHKSEESVKFESWVTKVKGTTTKAEQRILAIGEFRFATFRVSTMKGIALAREGHFRQITKVEATEERIDISCTDFLFAFMSDRLEEAAVALAGAYDFCMHGQPMERFAEFDVSSDATEWFQQAVEAASAARTLDACTLLPTAAMPGGHSAAAALQRDPTAASSAAIRANTDAARAAAEGSIVSRDDAALALRVVQCESALRGRAVPPHVAKWLSASAVSEGRELIFCRCVPAGTSAASAASPRRRSSALAAASALRRGLRPEEWLGRAHVAGSPLNSSASAASDGVFLPRAPWTAVSSLAVAAAAGPHALATAAEGLDDALLEAVAEAVLLTDCFSSLDAAGVSIGDSGGVRLAPALAGSRSLVRVVLPGCGLGPAAAAAIGKALRVGGTARGIRSLVLSENPIGDKGLRAMLPGLLRCSALERLEVATCALTHASLCPLFEALNQDPSPLPALGAIDLSANALGGKASSALAAWLQGPAAVGVALLGVGDSGVSWPVLAAAHQRAEGGIPVMDAAAAAPPGQDVSALAAALAATESPQVLVLDRWAKDTGSLATVVGAAVLAPKRAAASISLRHIALGQGFDAVAAALAASTSLRAVDLSHTAIPAEELAGFLNRLAGPTAAPSLRVLVLDNALAGDCSPALVSALEAVVATGAVTDLHLRRLSKESRRVNLAPALSALANTQAVTAIAVSGNGLTDSDATILAKVLQTNTTLTALEAVTGNSMSPRGVGILAEAIQAHGRICQLGKTVLPRDKGAGFEEAVNVLLQTANAIATKRTA